MEEYIMATAQANAEIMRGGVSDIEHYSRTSNLCKRF